MKCRMIQEYKRKSLACCLEDSYPKGFCVSCIEKYIILLEESVYFLVLFVSKTRNTDRGISLYSILEFSLVVLISSSDDAPEDSLSTEISLCKYLSKLQNRTRLVRIVPVGRCDTAELFFSIFPRLCHWLDRKRTNIANNFLMFMIQSESVFEVF